MRVTLLQTDIAYLDIAANHAAAEEAINAAPGADLYVLPEMWSTGFIPHPDGCAEREKHSLRWMQTMAKKIDAAITGSVATEVEGVCFNRMYFVTPENTYVYDKHHLFSYSGENLNYAPGERRVVVEWRGVRFLLQVCYDLRFPVFSRNSADEALQYDCTLYVASWPESRRRPWEILLAARAIENQCYVCGVNRVGDDSACHYNGGTRAIDPYGRIIAQCADDRPAACTFDIDIEALRAFRKKFPVLDDAD